LVLIVSTHYVFAAFAPFFKTTLTLEIIFSCTFPEFASRS
jgi:hypothetical protein